MQITKEQWVAALRSGEYKQGYGSLYQDKNGNHLFTSTDLSKVCSVCAIGVLGVIARKAGHASDTIYPLANKLLGMPESSRGTTPSEDIIKLNDNEKLTFNTIADFIESYTWEPPKTYLG